MTQTGGKPKKTRRTVKRRVAKRPVRRTQKAGARKVKRRVKRSDDSEFGSHFLNVRQATNDDIFTKDLMNIKSGRDHRFIRSPLMDMPPHVQMDPMNNVSAYLSDYYMNVDIDKLARQLYGTAIHAVHGSSVPYGYTLSSTAPSSGPPGLPPPSGPGSVPPPSGPGSVPPPSGPGSVPPQNQPPPPDQWDQLDLLIFQQ